MYKCDICGKEFESKFAVGPHKKRKHDATYIKPDNGLRGKPSWNKGLTKETDSRVKQASDTYNERFASGHIVLEYKGIPRSIEIREKISNSLRIKLDGVSPHGGRILYKVLDSFGNEVFLQSSYELRVYNDLVNNSIKWLRPKALPYLAKDGKNRRYFADFYLPDYDVYLDPKNLYLIAKDTYKINQVMIENNVRVIMLNVDQLLWDIILKIIEI